MNTALLAGPAITITPYTAALQGTHLIHPLGMRGTNRGQHTISKDVKQGSNPRPVVRE